MGWLLRLATVRSTTLACAPGNRAPTTPPPRANGLELSLESTTRPAVADDGVTPEPEAATPMVVVPSGVPELVVTCRVEVPDALLAGSVLGVSVAWTPAGSVPVVLRV